MSSWPLFQEADVALCREKVSILAVTPCDWSKVDADNQGEEADCVRNCDRAGPEFGLQGGSNVADDSKHNVFVDWSKLPTWLYLPHRKSLVPSSLLELS